MELTAKRVLSPVVDILVGPGFDFAARDQIIIIFLLPREDDSCNFLDACVSRILRIRWLTQTVR